MRMSRLSLRKLRNELVWEKKVKCVQTPEDALKRKAYLSRMFIRKIFMKVLSQERLLSSMWIKDFLLNIILVA